MSIQSVPFSPSLPLVALSTDGGCEPNPGPGAWACTLRYGDHYKEISGPSEGWTTNNQMEFTAIIRGLQALKKPCRVTIRTDSKIAMAWCRKFSVGQIKKLPVVWKLVQEFRQAAERHVITFEYVKGHNGDPDNERCDELCTREMKKMRES